MKFGQLWNEMWNMPYSMQWSDLLNVDRWQIACAIAGIACGCVGIMSVKEARQYGISPIGGIFLTIFALAQIWLSAYFYDSFPLQLRLVVSVAAIVVSAMMIRHVYRRRGNGRIAPLVVCTCLSAHVVLCCINFFIMQLMFPWY